jgi:hypothetical protein
MEKMVPFYNLSSQLEIEQRALVIFEAEGRPAGRALEHWLQAETEFLAARLEEGRTRQPQGASTGLAIV